MRLFCKTELKGKLAFRELEAGACTWLTWLFALFHAWVTGKETLWFHQATVGWVNFREGAGDGVANRDGLCVLAATFDDDLHIELVDHVHHLERSDNGVLKIDRWEIFFERKTVDGHFSGTFGDACVRNSGFAASGGTMSDSSWHNNWENGD